LRILIAHNEYQQRAGEDAIVNNESALLATCGHDVRVVRVSNDAIAGMAAKARAAWRVTYSRPSRDRMQDEIAAFRAEIVHVHNFFPLLTPAVYDACRQADIPVVQSLHNFRPICAASSFFRDGHVCEDCLNGSPYQAVLHACYRGSRIGSFAVARMIAFHRKAGTWRAKVDRYIANTDFMRQKFVAAGFPAERITIKPNFVPDPGEPDNAVTRTGALFVGRLAAEKGLVTLFNAWRRSDVALAIVGDGPLGATLDGMANSRISRKGWLSPADVRAMMAKAKFLVMPSEWYEGFPMVLVEAAAHGLPAIASRLGAMAEIIDDGVTGLLFTPGDADDLASKVRWAVDHPHELAAMGREARRKYLGSFTPEANYRQLVETYQHVIAARAAGTST
jgi:glycosyltransferase involved in cell wall biosynthesis